MDIEWMSKGTVRELNFLAIFLGKARMLLVK